jgi:glucokinase
VSAVAAIDVGGTAMKGAIERTPGALEQAEARPTGRDDGAEAVLDRLAAFAEALCRAAPEPVQAVGVAVPGLVDEAQGIARAAVNLGWRDVPLRRRLEERLELPVAVAHDVRAAARAEGAFGAGRGSRNWLLVTLGTGVGAAVVLDGRPLGGEHGTGGELGHLVVRPDGPLCACGARGCVETLASAGAVEARYGTGETAQEIAARAAAEEEDRAVAVWRDAVDALAAGLAAAVVLLDPERIVLGGGLADAGPVLFSPLERALADKLTFVPAPPVVPAALGPEAGCQGAAVLAREIVP